ncbi:hypothetical protein GOP47_0018913 [Adiantum capillus-veneris]|uniref:Potassium transporter n=1 Tax=Adiantum capillus-veneris TaxID=13818 RepID=A0A9D4UE38_ADICA|nr:hypothetical protein GOP47_0018913 [Adiantum capillus-veneris]
MPHGCPLHLLVGASSPLQQPRESTDWPSRLPPESLPIAQAVPQCNLSSEVVQLVSVRIIGSCAKSEHGQNRTYKGNHQKTSWKAVLPLAYQSFGVVYGDLSTSPLYVYKSTFFGSKVRLSDSDAEIMGVLSFIFWTITLIPALKYVFIVLRADDNGEGGTFALYSLLCRHAKIGLLPNQQALDEELSTYSLEPPPATRSSHIIKTFLEGHQRLRSGVLIAVLLGTCMVIGDGILTPTISVLSAVSGLTVKARDLHENYVLLLACAVLVGLFALQHYGTRKVGFMFAPIVISWLFCISSIGVYNIFRWNKGVIKALSPYYMYKFLQKTGKEGWISLGGVVLCITGAEAMYADLGHFSQCSIKVAFTCAVYPCLTLAYMGQAAFLSRHPSDIERSFYMSIPRPVFWPVFVVATLASVVGSQAVISATFSIIKQAQALGCFPRVKVMHTSNHICGQIYIPEVNWILMVLCLAITVGFRDTIMIGNAYGVAVITVMLVTTCLMSVVMVIVWQKSVLLALAFLLFFGAIECLYFSASLTKVREGGWVPLAFSILFMAIMYIWHYGFRKKYEFDLQNKVSMKWLLTLGPSLGIVRVPGLGLIYTDLVTGVPPIFSHFVTNLPAFHKVLVFVCVKYVPVPFVPLEERCLIGRIGPKEFRMFRTEAEDQEALLGNELTLDGRLAVIGLPTQQSLKIVSLDNDSSEDSLSGFSYSKSPTMQSIHSLEESHSSHSKCRKKVRFELPETPNIDPAVRRELIELIEAQEAGVAYMLGHSYVKAKKDSSLIKKFVIDVVYNFLRNNCRGPTAALSIPHLSLIEVGMVYRV